MKTNILIADPFETGGGEEEVAYYIYKNLNRAQYNVFITGNENSQYFMKNFPDKNELIDIFVKGKFSFKRMRQFRNIVLEKNISIINVHGCSAGYFVRLACMGLKHVKIVWTTHGNIDIIHKDSGCLKRSFSVLVENILNNHAFFTDSIVTVCEETRDRLVKRGVKTVPINVIYNGINTDYFSDVKKDYHSNEELRLGFFSRLSKQKDIPLLLSTMKRLCLENKNISLLIAGDGDEKEYLKNYIEVNNLEKKVSYVGFQNDIRSLLSKIDVLVLPTHFECLPMILLEAMCSGTPVIASNVGGVAEIIHTNFNGIVVEPEDEDDFYNAIMYYYNNRSAIMTDGIKAREFVVNNFDVSVMMKKYDDVFMENVD